jgi:hypothetical protein
VKSPLKWLMASLGVSMLGMGGLAVYDLSELAAARKAVAEAERMLVPRSAVAAEVTHYKNIKNRFERTAGIINDLVQERGEKRALFQALERLPRKGVEIELVWMEESDVEIDARASSVPAMIGFAETVARMPGFSGVIPVRRRAEGEGPVGDGRGLPFTLRAHFARPDRERP